ncbi:MAG: class I SAM-dependent methyltransferase [Spirochaetales bacterium]
MECLNCSHVYQNPQPLFEELKNRYGDNYFHYEFQNEENFFQLMLLGLKDIAFETWEEPLRSKGAFLDIGCATGRLLSYMKERGWKVQGVEICEASAQYGINIRKVPIFIGPLEDAPVADFSFALIHASHLIEHLTDPIGFLKKVYALLIEGGQAVIVTPNISGLQAKLLGNKWRSCIPDHMQLFSKKNLKRCMQTLGFRILHIQTWGGIAKGLSPTWLKKLLDGAAKRYGFGDVVLFHVEKGRQTDS